MNEWELIDIKSVAKPTPRRASCLSAGDGFFLLFGGIAAAGYNNELWKFDWGTRTYELQASINSAPSLAYSSCNIKKNSRGEVIFTIYKGETYGEIPKSFIYEYNLTTYKWTQITEATKNYGLFNSKAADYIINDKLITAGGVNQNSYSLNTVHMLDINTGEISLLAHLPLHTYYAASVYYKNKIYIHGGASGYSRLPLKTLKSNDLTVIDLNHNCDSGNICISECSKGTYNHNGICYVCPEGSYSDDIGAYSCKLCPRGYSSSMKGAESSSTCKPCPYGSFTYNEGQARCLQCQNGNECSLNQERAIAEGGYHIYWSDQPDLLIYEEDKISLISRYFDTIVGTLFLVVTAILLKFKGTRKLIEKIDIYSVQHNYEIDKPMFIRNTLIGGLFSIGFVFGALSILFELTLSYAINNVVETKALVPLITVEEDYTHFQATEARFEFEFQNYIGNCAYLNNECTPDLEISLYNIKGFKHKPICSKVGLSCLIIITVQNFDLERNGSIYLKLSENESLSSEISVKVLTSSSIPDETSSISARIISEKDKYFRGSNPSEFRYLMIPSIFESNTGQWETDQTGYHVSLLEEPTQGSQIYVEE